MQSVQGKSRESIMSEVIKQEKKEVKKVNILLESRVGGVQLSFL